MAMKGYSTFPKAPRLEAHHKQDTRWSRGYPSVEVQLLYSTALADKKKKKKNLKGRY